MTLSTSDIENLDKIIYKIAENAIENTVPELLNGWQKFPNTDDRINNTYKHYESTLIDNHICSVKSDWTENSLYGFKYLQLDTNGYNIVLHKKSIKDFFDEKDKDQKPSSIYVVGHNNAFLNNQSSFDKSFNPDFNNKTPNKSKSIDWQKLLKIIGGIILIILAVLKFFGLL